MVERVRGVPERRAKAVGVADPDGAIAVAVREESPSRVTADVGVDETQEEVARVFDERPPKKGVKQKSGVDCAIEVGSGQ